MIELSVIVLIVLYFVQGRELKRLKRRVSDLEKLLNPAGGDTNTTGYVEREWGSV